MFSVEDVKKKYMDFLKLEPSDFESHADEVEDHQVVENEEEAKAQVENQNNDHEVNKEELIDELKKLEIGNQEDAYIDINYWKPAIEYDVDHLLAELTQ